MIECNITVKNDTIYFKDIEIEKCVDVYVVYTEYTKEFDTLEKAIKYIMDMKNDPTTD